MSDELAPALRRDLDAVLTPQQRHRRFGARRTQSGSSRDGGGGGGSGGSMAPAFSHAMNNTFVALRVVPLLAS